MASRKKTKRPAKTKTEVAFDRIRQMTQNRFNPIRNLTPAVLAGHLESFDAGYLRDATITWAKMEARDDTLKSVIPKRQKAVSRHGYEILTIDDSPRAALHKEKLEYFYHNLIARSVEDGNALGGVPLLVRQMMDSTGKKYAVHEIVYRPAAAGLTAELIFAPLWLFENTTGRLRYLPNEGATSGQPMEPGEWMVTMGDGLMIASSVAYMFKHMPLKDWVIYSERHGMPGIHGKTTAAKNTPEWNTLRDAVQNFGIDMSMITGMGASIEAIDLSSKGQLPFPKLVERMDRAMASMWRGADLSTMSSGSGEGTGASLQGGEMDLLEEDDADLVSDTLNMQLDRFVILHTTGDPFPLAYIKINTHTKQNVEHDIKIDEFLIKNGLPVAVDDVLERYGRARPDDDEELISAPGGTGGPSLSPSPSTLANQKIPKAKAREVADQLSAASRKATSIAVAKDLQEVRTRIESILAIDDQDFIGNALRNLQRDLPKLLKQMNKEPRAAKEIEEALASALINGYTEAAVEHEVEAAA